MGSPSRRSASQNRALWALVREIEGRGLSHDEAVATLRQACIQVSGQDHTSRLTPGQAGQVIDTLKARLGQSRGRGQRTAPAPHEPWDDRGPGPRDDATAAPITPRQVEVLDALFAQAGMTTLPQRVAFTKRQCRGQGRPRSQRDADALFEALSAMVMRGVAPMDIWMEARELLADGRGLDSWQRHTFLPDLLAQFEVAAPDHLDQVLTPHKLAKLVEARHAHQRAVAEGG